MAVVTANIAKSKENWKKVSEYFENLQINYENYEVCSDLLKYLDLKSVVNFEEYIKFYGEISSKGIYSYDSYDFSKQERPYFKVTIPQNDLLFENLPQDIKAILEDLKLPETNFAKHSLISDEVIYNL